jgi:2-amino-4-hydroxy-6-hydroxymethyldihydropteridine diphosphokinase
MHRTYIELGSNLGDRLQTITQAAELLEDLCDPVAYSSIYETEPVDMDSEHLFLNMVIAADTLLDPSELLTQLKKLEERLGRRPQTHHLDRLIDCDILLYEGMIYRNSMVTIPHPLMDQRRFVLVPFAEIAPAVVHPLRRLTIRELLEQCTDHHRVERTAYQLSLTH